LGAVQAFAGRDSKTELNIPGGRLYFVNCEEIKGNGLDENSNSGCLGGREEHGGAEREAEDG
jgi:hypothetical protein